MGSTPPVAREHAPDHAPPPGVVVNVVGDVPLDHEVFQAVLPALRSSGRAADMSVTR